MSLSSDIRRDVPPSWTMPAPGPDELETLRLLLNTDNRFVGVDVLADPTSAREAVRELGFVDLDRVTDDDIAELTAFRDALRTLTDGDEPRWDLIETFAERHPVHLTMSAKRRGLIGSDGIATMLAMLFASLEHGTWQRVKHCANPDCRWAYFDGSKNRSAKWCSMSECGELMKSRAYRERHRAVAD